MMRSMTDVPGMTEAQSTKVVNDATLITVLQEVNTWMHYRKAIGC